jgi:Gpi18-like mannosyltransferase
MICFIFIANQELRELNLLCYNDSLLAMYALLCIHFCVHNRPLVGSLMFSLSVSVKAGSVLILPALLGVTQYRHGTFKLI